MTSMSVTSQQSCSSDCGTTVHCMSRGSPTHINTDTCYIGHGLCDVESTADFLKDVHSKSRKTFCNEFPNSTHLVNSNTTSSILQRPIVARMKKSKSKHVTFGFVEVFHFDRLQGFTCVPSQGGSTLGMCSEHWITERIPVTEHQCQRKYQRHSALLRFCLEGKLLLSLQQFQTLESRVKSQQQSLYKSNNSGECTPTLSIEATDTRLHRSLKHDENASDNELSFLDGLEEYYFLQPLPAKRRRSILRKSGLQKIDPTEKHECAAIRKSRSECGCTCLSGLCDPETCECALNGISCQVDRAGFPCLCISPRHCLNPEGRIEFNPVRVRTHYLHTHLKIESERQQLLEKEDIIRSAKRPRIVEMLPFYADDDNARENGEEYSSVDATIQNGRLATSCTTSKDSTNAECAVQMKTANMGCQDCRNDRYVHILMKELHCEQNFQANGSNDPEHKDAMMEFEQMPMLSDNLIIGSPSCFHRSKEKETKELVCEVDSFIEPSSQSFINANRGSHFTCNVPFDDEEEDDDEEEKEEDDDQGGDPSEFNFDKETTTSNLKPIENGPMNHEKEMHINEKIQLSTRYRLEPISSLFRNRTESTGARHGGVSNKGTPVAVPSSPPSIFEVVSA